MDFSNPGLLLSGLVISMVGLAIFVYGKKTEKPKSLAITVNAPVEGLLGTWIWPHTPQEWGSVPVRADGLS